MKEQGHDHGTCRWSRGTGLVLGVVAVLVFATSVGSTAADVRAELPVSSAKIFARMLQSAEQADYGKVSQGLQLLDPLSRHLTATFSVDVSGEVSRALGTGDKDQVIMAVQRYVVLSIRGLLRASVDLGSDGAAIREKLRLLAQEQLVLDPYVKKVDFATSATLRQLIQHLGALAGKEPDLFKAKAVEFESALATVFPSE